MYSHQFLLDSLWQFRGFYPKELAQVIQDDFVFIGFLSSDATKNRFQFFWRNSSRLRGINSSSRFGDTFNQFLSAKSVLSKDKSGHLISWSI